MRYENYFRDIADRHKKEYEREREQESEAIIKPATDYFFNEYAANINETPVYREARAIRCFIERCEIRILPHELVAGKKPYSPYEIAGFHFGGGTYIRDDLLESYSKNFTDYEKTDFYNKVDAIKKAKFMSCWDSEFNKYHKGFFTPEEEAALYTGASGTTAFGGHIVIDYEGLMRGISDYRQKILESPRHESQFNAAMTEILTAFSILISRTAAACLVEASCATDEALKANMLDLHKDLSHISENPPESFRQALQLVWFAHIMSDTDTFGRFDKYLYPYYKRDTESGVLSKETALCLLQSLMIKIDEAEDIQNMTIGGEYEDDLRRAEFTELILSAVRSMKYKGPNLSFRICANTPPELWDAIAQTLQTGQGLPALYSDDIMVRQLLSIGIPPVDANDYCLAGCSQIMIPGKSQFANDIGMMNIAKILELTLYNGIDKAVTDIDTGFRTGVIEEFDTFDKLLSAFKKQLSYYAALEASINNKIVELYAKTEGFSFRTLFVNDCLKKEKNIYNGGAAYNNIQLECIGITNASDSLIAIKKTVYDNKLVSLTELCAALLNNFSGYEQLRMQLINAPKFGNDNTEADEIRKDITEHLFSELRRQKAVIGGIYIPGEVIFTAHDIQGSHTGATPDGRLKGEVLADSAGASQGMDRSGPTALLNSVLKIPVDKICTSIVCNIKFSKKLFAENRQKFIYLLQSFFANGGQQLQINVCDKQTLLDAYQNPQSHKNLVVRVGGFSAYFHTLSKNLQQDIINRIESTL